MRPDDPYPARPHFKDEPLLSGLTHGGKHDMIGTLRRLTDGKGVQAFDPAVLSAMRAWKGARQRAKCC